MGPFQYNTFHPDHETVFNAFMADTTRRATAAILAAHDFAGYRIIVDVGGGNGTLLSSILARTPGSTGIVFNFPEVMRKRKASRGNRLRWWIGASLSRAISSDPLRK